jgi:hypothetical protein
VGLTIGTYFEEPVTINTSGGLDENSHNFNILPPHFKIPTSVVEVIPQSIYSRASNSFRATFPYLVASVIYHEHLPENHPFFTSLIYTRNYKSIWGPLIVTGFFENELSGMRSSGLSKYINVLCENEKVREEIRAIPDAVVSKISSANNVQIYKTELIDRQFGHRFDNIENILATNFTRSRHLVEGLGVVNFMLSQKALKYLASRQ